MVIQQGRYTEQYSTVQYRTVSLQVLRAWY